MNDTVAEFRRRVWNNYRKEGRHDLPWRKTKDPYKLLVSEMMLQQTQVSRVIPKYKAFLKKFPTVQALSRASLQEVLKEWSGLGYNRRAKYLHDAAKTVTADKKLRGHNNIAAAMLLCKGIGPYTRAAVRVFAFNEPHTMIETNIRTAYIHYFFPAKSRVVDKELSSLIERGAEGQDPREWHWALMDYGANLKASGVRNNAQSAHYTKQSKFRGSLREVRGAILKAMHAGKRPSTLPFEKSRIMAALESLKKDGLIEEPPR